MMVTTRLIQAHFEDNKPKIESGKSSACAFSQLCLLDEVIQKKMSFTVRLHTIILPTSAISTLKISTISFSFLLTL